MDFSPRPGIDLLLSIPPARFSNPWTDRPHRDTPRVGISEKRCRTAWLLQVLVCSNCSVVFERLAHAQRTLLDWHGCGRVVSPQYLATRNAGNLFRLLSIVRQRSA